MKKIMSVVWFLAFLCFVIYFSIQKPIQNTTVYDDSIEEVRAIYISYIELSEYLDKSSGEEVEEGIHQMIENVYQDGFNLILLHTRSFSDSIYPSNVFPSHYLVTRRDTGELPLDILNTFIREAHQKNIKVHAWINPFRIRNDESFQSIDVSNPCYKWIGTNHIRKIDGKGIFYNPASDEVQDLIIRGIEEILTRYDVDGIHFDDYFYPDQSIDLENYQLYQQENLEQALSIKEYRLENINRLIKRVYETVHRLSDHAVFGIAPDGNIRNNYENHYADIYTWLKEDGYVDYIMPQVYYGFQNETKPYIDTLNEWSKTIQNHSIQLLLALALYKSGHVDQYAVSGMNEWLEQTNIIQNQIQVGRKIEHYHGFSIFRYDHFYHHENEMMMAEVENIRSVFKKS